MNQCNIKNQTATYQVYDLYSYVTTIYSNNTDALLLIFIIYNYNMMM
jgi:hypothetical protein